MLEIIVYSYTDLDYTELVWEGNSQREANLVLKTLIRSCLTIILQRLQRCNLDSRFI